MCACVCVCVCVGFVMCVWESFVMCGCFGNMYTVLWLRFFLPWLRFFRSLPSVLRQIPGWNSQRRGTARTLPHELLFVLFGCYLCCSMYCLCVNVYCHRVTTQLQSIITSHHINSLRRFRGNLSVPSSGSRLKMGPTGCPRTSVRNYHYSVRNDPEEHSSLPKKYSDTWS